MYRIDGEGRGQKCLIADSQHSYFGQGMGRYKNWFHPWTREAGWHTAW